MSHRRFTAIGSSHLFGLINVFSGPMSDRRYQYVWDEGRPARDRLVLNAPEWDGDFVLYNTPAAGPAPVLKDGVLYMAPALIDVLKHVDPSVNVIFSLMRGQEYAMASLVDDPGHADFNAPDSPCERGRQWMSLDDADAWVDAIAAPLLTTDLALKHHFPKARIVHVPAPPPIESEPHIREHAEGFSALFDQHGIKPFGMRKRLYDRMYQRLNAALAAHGIASLPVPVGALTEQGGLRADHARGCLHGNDRYARLLAEEMKRSLAHAPV